MPTADSAQRAASRRPIAKDRAPVVTVSVIQIFCSTLTAWLHREHVDVAGARAAIEQYLREEFADIEREAAGRGDVS